MLLGGRWRWLAAPKPAAVLPGASNPAPSPLAAPAGALSAAPGRCSAARAASGPQALVAAPAARASLLCLAAQLGSAATQERDVKLLMHQDSMHGAFWRIHIPIRYRLHCSAAYLGICCRTRSSCCVKEKLALGGDLRWHRHVLLHSAGQDLTTLRIVEE